MRFVSYSALFAIAAAIATVEIGRAETNTNDDLLASFQNPPAKARPRTWWHWLSGNVSREGITKDLEWMTRIGLGGAQVFDGDMGAPQVVERRVAALSPEWRANMKFAASEADRLGLEFAMAAAPGWSETGGPWVKPEAAMKKVVWSETRIKGSGKSFQLVAPPSVAGPFQDIPLGGEAWGHHVEIPSLYRDIAVLAFKAPKGDFAEYDLKPKMSANVDVTGLERLMDGDLTVGAELPDPRPDSPVWIQYSFDAPQSIRALKLVGPLTGRYVTGPNGYLQVGEEGNGWINVVSLVGAGQTPAPQRTFSFPAVTGTRFRVIFDSPAVSREPWGKPPGISIKELVLVPGARVNYFEDKAGFGVAYRPDQTPTSGYSAAETVSPEGVIDLTDRLASDGMLKWSPPPGDWVVLRIGCSLTGKTNHPATPEATGLEVDKLDADHVRLHLESYILPLVKEFGPLAGERGLQYILTDSWEAGVQNWTGSMVAEFKKRRRYDPRPFLPVLTGRIVGSPEQSDDFLWDYRKTLSELLAENHYGVISTFAATHGLGYYGEAVGASRPTIADGMLAKRYTDIPMGEFWEIPEGELPAGFQGVPSDEFPADIVETASTANIFGKSLVAAEALTSSQSLWTSSPRTLKSVADKYLAMGVNRLVLHTSPHQPDDAYAPGLTLGPFGQTFSRHETWAEMARPWITYLSRVSHMLQQGRAVADVLCLYSEGAPSGVPYRAPGEPFFLEGFATDYVNSYGLIELATVKDGRIVFPSGARYEVLVLPRDVGQMTLATVRKIRDLVLAGATVIGPRPESSPSLEDRDDELRNLAMELWGQVDGSAITRRSYGKGAVVWGESVGKVLERKGVEEDVQFLHAGRGELVHAHRELEQGHVYFIANQANRAMRVESSFRVRGFQAEFWHPDTGAAEPAPYSFDGDRTRVPMELEPHGSVLVVFRRASEVASRELASAPIKELARFDSNWTVRFQKGRGVSESIVLDTMKSLSNHDDPGVRYFSGIASYSRKIEIEHGWIEGAGRVWLDLGEVRDLAQVFVNGHDAGIAWKRPFRVDISPFLEAGQNELEIHVANVWRNRVVGDQVMKGENPVSRHNPTQGGFFTFMGREISKDTPLLDSGLLGPVVLSTQAR